MSVVGKQMSWGEAWRLTQRLALDPSSQVAAAVSGWNHPASAEALAVMSLYDLTHQIAWRQGGSKGSRPKPHPRPWPDKSRESKKFGKAALPIADLRRVLDAHRAAVDRETETEVGGDG